VALVTSGTATLETALFGVPQVVCYKGSPISYHIAKRLIKVTYISLVNLILNRELVTELIQHECNPRRMQEELDQIINGPQAQIIKDGYLELENLLGGGGASERTAQHMLKSIAKR
jgi:lipid-A-disaccharide synthase